MATTNGVEFKGDQSSGGRKGGVVSSSGVNPAATDQLMQGAQRAGPPAGGAAPSPGPSGGGGSPLAPAPDFFETPGEGIGPPPQRLLPEDKDARIRALYRAFPNEDLRRLLEFRDRG